MINWKRLSAKQLDELELYADEHEVVLVDPTARFDSITMFLFEANTVFSEKQLKRYKSVTSKELEVIKEKLEQYGAYLSGESYDDGC